MTKRQAEKKINWKLPKGKIYDIDIRFNTKFKGYRIWVYSIIDSGYKIYTSKTKALKDLALLVKLI